MLRKIFFFTKSLLLSSIIIGSLLAAEISIIPLKKPILDKEAQQTKIPQGFIKPISKIKNNIEEFKDDQIRKKNRLIRKTENLKYDTQRKINSSL